MGPQKGARTPTRRSASLPQFTGADRIRSRHAVIMSRMSAALNTLPLASLGVSTRVMDESARLTRDLLDSTFVVAQGQVELKADMQRQFEMLTAQQAEVQEVQRMLREMVGRLGPISDPERELAELTKELERSRADKQQQEQALLEQMASE